MFFYKHLNISWNCRVTNCLSCYFFKQIVAYWHIPPYMDRICNKSLPANSVNDLFWRPIA